MSTILTVAQVVISVALIVLILLQERSAGVSGVFGGDSAGFYQARRGLERVTYAATIVLVIAFAIVSLANLS